MIQQSVLLSSEREELSNVWATFLVSFFDAERRLFLHYDEALMRLYDDESSVRGIPDTFGALWPWRLED